MSSPATSSDREKVVSKLPGWLRQNLKIRAAQHGIEIQAAVELGIRDWCGLASATAPVDTAGADSFSTFLPPGQWEEFRQVATDRGVSLIQGLAQSVQLWLDANPAPDVARPEVTRRIIVCNQKGGVGKTAITAGLGEALAEDPNNLYAVRVAKALAKALRASDVHSGDAPTNNPLDIENLPGLGLRVLLVDFDPQCHLTNQLGAAPLPMNGDSLTNHMAGDPKGDLRDLIVSIDDTAFGDRLHLLPACNDAFLLDVRLSAVRAREAALERALAPLEAEYDVILVDCPPSLGLSMDAAAYYGRRRDGEKPGQSGALIVVQAEDSSADAYELLTTQIDDLRGDLQVDIDYLGIVVNLYDSRRGFIATSSLQGWVDIKDPRVVGLIGDLKEQKEAVRMKQPLLSYAPKSQQAIGMRALAREIA
ncbi:MULTISPECIES: ParA family protein [Streptomyces]|uniref:ParA family protein n=1 Tax=Streptomyces caniscabiei TaxID=2746961 RepID=A0ABU4N3K4_9ACTN|nr:ParA family protein [Streptomyces caniscabiei]MBE4741596.1 ParA family protein [Streptomyces caniscabiei]MBE4761982.1 ParA family protein [Streptomyces caniscabiei]MBE4775244.1 ParA family protein [Streptomyces caniscabiei]MBE4790372.1 ParA family protein [Streptomyces caniscabiei]MBE4799637.1 ParA family protein [Streptomyces caniscabiei]